MHFTNVVVDNTTFAAAGRVMYSGDLSVEGGQHAEDYYRKFKDQKRSDAQSFLELLTALILFDSLSWNGSSAAQDARNMNDAHWFSEEETWVYKWFPLFWMAANQGNAIQHRTYTGDRKTDGVRLEKAQRVAVEWTRQYAEEKNRSLPLGFRTPIVYLDPKHHERWEITSLLEQRELQFTDDKIALALFLSRGLFYQSETLSEPGLSYLPHSYRAVLLSDPTIASLSLTCSEQVADYLKPRTYKDPMDGIKVMREIQKVFSEELKHSKGLESEEFNSAMSIAGAFLQRTKGDCKGAFCDVMEFRETGAGKRLREQVREMVILAEESKLLPLKARLERLRKELQDIEREQLGHASQSNSANPYLIDLIEKGLGSQGFLLKPLLSLIPLEAREAVTKFGNITFFPSGFQLIFRNYFT
jgi:hypothetical protein